MSVACPQWSAIATPGVGRCAAGKFGGIVSYATCDVCLGKPPRAPLPELTETEGPKRWAELHRRAMSGWINPSEMAFVITLADGMGACTCRGEWRTLLKRMPPDLSSPEAYFAWSVAVHNAVNLRLGKPPLTLEAARAKWSTSPATTPP
jgi:hypothetical protein